MHLYLRSRRIGMLSDSRFGEHVHDRDGIPVLGIDQIDIPLKRSDGSRVAA